MSSRRVTRPRSRNGCITCKIRHVKCDEQKPACMQCQKSGRKCDGYDSASQTELRQRIAERHKPLDRNIINADHRLVLRHGTPEERRFVDFFYTRTSSAFSGFYDSKLWSYLIPQFGEQEPSVRHAMTAIGAFHSRARITAMESEETNRFVLEEYNKSIQTLVKALSRQTESIDLTLTTCCLFVCLEMMRNNQKQALDHIEAGLRIIYKHEQTTACSSELYRQLRELFLRLNLQASFMGRLMVPLRLCSSERVRSGSVFRDMQESRTYLDNLLTKALLFIRSVGITREPQEPIRLVELEIEQDEVREEMHAWRWSHDKLLQKLDSKIQTPDLCASLLQRTYYHTAYIWSMTVLGRSEDGYDNYRSDFEAVVSCAEEFITITSKTKDIEEPENFSLEAEIIGPLYYAACRCRHPFIRRRALNILQHYSKREGMWDAKLYTAVSKLVIEVEESQCLTPPTTEKDISSRARVHEDMLTKDSTCNPTPVVFCLKPEGVDGPWAFRTVWVGW